LQDKRAEKERRANTVHHGTNETVDDTCVTVVPGICGFTCRIHARKKSSRQVAIEIRESNCLQIQRLADRLSELSFKDLFLPLTRNPVYIAAEKSGCHPSCLIPCAVLKAVEAAMGMALPRTVQIEFETC
jgi:hypothetical protein